MNLRDLSYIIAVADTRHFGKAAQRCFVSQPTLSGQIRKLEDELGVTIFERTNRSVRVTTVGEEILRHARQMMEQADAIRSLATAQRDPLAGPLRIGAIPTISPYLMPLILAPLKQQHPKLKLVLSEEIYQDAYSFYKHYKRTKKNKKTKYSPNLTSTPTDNQYHKKEILNQNQWVFTKVKGEK